MRIDHLPQPVRAEYRAIEKGRNAVVQPDGSVIVLSETGRAHYRVTFFADGEGLSWFLCTCPSGQDPETGRNRRNLVIPVPCSHSAKAARRLEREGLVHWTPKGWWLSSKVHPLPSGSKAGANAPKPSQVPAPAPAYPAASDAP